jgi:hypothetical protein
MARTVVKTNGQEVINIMKSGAMESFIASRAALVQSAAQSNAPVDEGDYRDSIEVMIEQHPTRVVAHIGATVDYAMIVEANTGNLSRALDSAR